MAEKFSKRKAAPERKRSESNRTGGQAPLKEHRNAKRVDNATHGIARKRPGSRRTG